MFIIQTTIDRRAMTDQARVNRRTLRRGRNGPVRMLAWFVVILETFLTVVYVQDGQSGWVINLLLATIMLASILGEDAANGLAGLRQIPLDSREVNTAFRDDSCYIRRTQSGEDWWPYREIKVIGETEEYFVFLLDRRHGQVYSKEGFSWGDPDEFRDFIQRKTGLKIQKIRHGLPFRPARRQNRGGTQ